MDHRNNKRRAYWYSYPVNSTAWAINAPFSIRVAPKYLRLNVSMILVPTVPPHMHVLLLSGRRTFFNEATVLLRGLYL